MSQKQSEEAFDVRLAEMGIRIKDANMFKVKENVFDEVTLLALYKLVHKKWFSVIGGSISTGKEANVFYGEREDVPLAIKIYRIQSANFTTMSSYITGDRRFSHVKKSRKDLIFAWTRKEFSNSCGHGMRVSRYLNRSSGTGTFSSCHFLVKANARSPRSGT